MTWRMNGMQFVEGVALNPATNPDSSWLAAATTDIDRDGDPDVIWRNAMSGELMTWLMAGSARVMELPLNPAQPGDANWLLLGPR